ncbi:hypothetical protein [Streptomyces sp. NPDC002913]
MLPDAERRICRFLSYQRIGRLSGRIIGRRGYTDVDGGMALAERYAAVHNVTAATFWADLRRVQDRGAVERVVAPAPGRRAVYALVLRADAIPQDLPEDLARALRIYDLPEPADPYEDVRIGRLADENLAELAELDVRQVPQATAAAWSSAPRWEHPAGTVAAAVAEAIQAASRAVPEQARPDLRTMAVASRSTTAERLAARFGIGPETSPLYAKGSSPVFYASSAMWELSYLDKHGSTKADAYGGTNKSGAAFVGDDPAVVAEGLMRRVWASWRAQLGHRKVILPTGGWNEAGEWSPGTGDSRAVWAGLTRNIATALSLTATPGEVFEILAARVTDAEDLGRLAHWRLRRLIERRRPVLTRRIPVSGGAATDAGGHRGFPAATGVGRETREQPLYNPAADVLRARLREEAAERKRAADELTARQYARWGITVAPLREPEAVHASRWAEDAATATRAPDREAAAREMARRNGDGTGRQRRRTRAADPAPGARERMSDRMAKYLKGNE